LLKKGLMDSREPSRPRVLIVDDRPRNLLAFEAVIESLDVEIVKAESGDAALGHLLRGDFAVILLDVQMPGLNGLETTELIKKREQSRHIPIILISASSSEVEHIFKGYQHGVVDYLLKPVDGDILRSKVSVFVELYRRGETIKRQAMLLGEAKAKDAFLTVFAHELRTPLTTAKVQAQLAIRRLCEGDPDTVRALSSITRQIDKLVKLVHDLLDITRFEDGRMSLERREFDVSALLEEQRERMQAFCGDAYQLRVRAPAQLQVVADRNRIDQVLTNLISNAVRYSPNGGSIEIAAEAVDGLLHLTVRDHGIGIPPSKQSFIFERFARAHGSAYGGLGLGLTIARSIVELHGGKMWVQSSGVTGEGSTFHAQIPLLAPESSLLVHAPDREAMM
jgi:signal transduction histidine kinase